MAASMFMNSNSLPIALMQSLVVAVPHLKWDEDDNTDSMVGRALTYLVLYSTLGMVLRWSYGVRLLAQADEELVEEPVLEDDNETSLLLSNSEATLSSGDPQQPLHHYQSNLTTSPRHIDDQVNEISHSSRQVPACVVEDANTLRPPVPRRRTTFFHSFPNSPSQSRLNLAETPSQTPPPESEEDDDEHALPQPYVHRQPTSPTSSRFQSILRRTRRRLVKLWRAFNEFMTVPLWAALASLIVACVQPLQHALDVHLTPIKVALSQAGNCSIPLTLVVLGAYFYPSKEATDEAAKKYAISTMQANPTLLERVRSVFSFKKTHRRHNSSNGSTSSINVSNSRRGETKTVVIAIMSRMVIIPLLLLPLMAVSTWYDWQEVFADPVFVVANVLLISSPPALTLAQITQAAASGDAFERLISRTIFWSYCIVTPPATILYVVLGMLLAKL